MGRKIGSLGIAKCWFFVSGKTKCDNTGRLKLPFFCAVGKIFKIIWVVLHVTKVRSVFFQGTAKLSVVFWSFVGGCVRRLTLAGNGCGHTKCEAKPSIWVRV